jgi:hypothetical protein
MARSQYIGPKGLGGALRHRFGTVADFQQGRGGAIGIAQPAAEDTVLLQRFQGAFNQGPAPFRLGALVRARRFALAKLCGHGWPDRRKLASRME